MDYLWSPWRFRYVSEGARRNDCPFCDMIRQGPARDREQYILCRAQYNFAFLNLYPYAPGHILVAPYAHAASLSALGDDVLKEMMVLARRAETALKVAYHADGYNVGMNLGKCAGAGVADHLHLHCLPRWGGDTNFMSTIAETRVLPEDLPTTFGKLVELFQKAD